jgi:hypothetical protein
MNGRLNAPGFSPSYIQRALNIISEHDLRAPDNVGLEIIVKAAFEAQTLFFGVALLKPDSHKLGTFFDAFVLECVR